jgi:serine/threonine protein kinase
MRVFDEGVYYQEHPFLVADYLPKTLAEVIRSGSATLTKKVAFTLQLLSALRYLDVGLTSPVIHRDIKPQNIFVKGNSCVLGDWGLMKRVALEGANDQAIFKESLGVGMPYRYRTPDLVDYLVKGTTPTTKSDVFQLGLVVAEIFTGRNPLKPTDDFASPIELEPLAKIPSAMARGIAALIMRMLETDPAIRDAAAKLLDPWQGVFLDAAKRSHDLDGTVFI